jgi:hypothetical protein
MSHFVGMMQGVSNCELSNPSHLPNLNYIWSLLAAIKGVLSIDEKEAAYRIGAEMSLTLFA